MPKIYIISMLWLNLEFVCRNLSIMRFFKTKDKNLYIAQQNTWKSVSFRILIQNHHKLLTIIVSWFKINTVSFSYRGVEQLGSSSGS